VFFENQYQLAYVTADLDAAVKILEARFGATGFRALGGMDPIANTVTVEIGGTLSPGSSTAILNTGSVSLTVGSTLNVEWKVGPGRLTSWREADSRTYCRIDYPARRQRHRPGTPPRAEPRIGGRSATGRRCRSDTAHNESRALPAISMYTDCLDRSTARL
jgi:hypothetical protein